MPSNLRQTQIESKRLFAPHALEAICVTCNLASMRVRLSEIREQRGERQELIAERAGVSISTVSRWEAGKMNITSSRLKDIADAYQCRVSDIFDDSELPYDPMYAVLPNEDLLKGILEQVQREIPVRTPWEDWPKHAASALRTRLQQQQVGVSKGDPGPDTPDDLPKAKRFRAPNRPSARA